jgi:Tfp pilus assembly protein PilO
MKRTHVLLAVLAAVLVVVSFWLLLWQPKQDEIVATREEIQATHDQQRMIEAELVHLRSVRESAPEGEALLAAAGAIVPDRPNQPSLLRQLQTAADDARLTLTSVNFGRPADSLPEGQTIASLPTNLAIEGGYFQIVDFLRRIEAPEITPRGVLWDSITITEGEYPTLVAALSGRTFAAAAMPPAEVDDAQAPTDDAETAAEADADVTVEVER